MMMKLALQLACASNLVYSSQAVTAYLSYTDAVCTDQYNIQGTYVMSYDDSDYADYGVSSDYEGGCMYFVGGSWSLDDWDMSSTEFYGYGECVECNGVVGCSSDSTCDNFMTTAVAQSSSSYQLSQGGSSTQSESELPQLSLVSSAKRASVQASTTERSEEYRSTGNIGSQGTIFAGVAVVGLAGVALTAAIRRKRSKKTGLLDGQVELASSANYYLA